MKVRRRMRCPRCESLETVKNGRRINLDFSLERKSTRTVQRYQCKECRESFTIRGNEKSRYTKKFKLKLTKMHTEERMSYRVISKRVREEYLIRISKNTVCRIVNEIAGQSKGDIAIKQEYQLQWSGYINVDDKYVRLGGKKNMMLVATDKTGDVVHTELLEVEEQQRIDEFFRFIKEHLHYRFKGVTTDLDEMLEKSIVQELGNDVPHQKCLKHALDNIVKIVELLQKKKRLTKLKETGRYSAEEYKKAALEYSEAENIYLTSKKMLYSSEEDVSLELLRELSRYNRKYPKLCEFFDRHLEKLLTHQRVPAISKTNNIAENINRQLMRRLKTIESFQSFSTAENYLNLYKNYLRFKPYTDCRGSNKLKNGKSPLEVCGGMLKSKDWLKNSIYSY